MNEFKNIETKEEVKLPSELFKKKKQEVKALHVGCNTDFAIHASGVKSGEEFGVDNKVNEEISTYHGCEFSRYDEDSKTFFYTKN